VEIADRVVKDYRNAYKPMAMATMPEMFQMYTVEQALLPQLKVKLHIINVDYYPVNEEALKQYATHGYEITNIHGTCHFPMIEDPNALNVALKQAIHKIEESVTPEVV
jgi:sigma-B regulation protein RsbQ